MLCFLPLFQDDLPLFQGIKDLCLQCKEQNLASLCLLSNCFLQYLQTNIFLELTSKGNVEVEKR